MQVQHHQIRGKGGGSQIRKLGAFQIQHPQFRQVPQIRQSGNRCSGQIHQPKLRTPPQKVTACQPGVMGIQMPQLRQRLRQNQLRQSTPGHIQLAQPPKLLQSPELVKLPVSFQQQRPQSCQPPHIQFLHTGKANHQLFQPGGASGQELLDILVSHPHHQYPLSEYIHIGTRFQAVLSPLPVLIYGRAENIQMLNLCPVDFLHIRHRNPVGIMCQPFGLNTRFRRFSRYDNAVHDFFHLSGLLSFRSLYPNPDKKATAAPFRCGCCQSYFEICAARSGKISMLRSRMPFRWAMRMP